MIDRIPAPRDTAGLLRRGERWVGRAARHRKTCCIFVMFLALSLRLALLPLLPIPKPMVHDEFSYLLGGDTFAKGRLANPPHPLSEFFETFQVNLHPTYASKYPPGQALMLALGIAVVGQAWFGVLFSVALMCGLVCWAIQGWLPPKYALYGGVFTVLIFGLDHYWVDSYWGGAVAACGGAMVLGAIPRLLRRPGPGVAVMAAIGAVVLANSRPYEGLVFLCAAGLGFLWWARRQGYVIRRPWIAMALPAVLILIAGAGAMAYYNFAVTGSATTLPYTIYQRQYAASPVFWVMPPPPPAHRVYRDRFMREFWEDWEAGYYAKARKNPLRILKDIADLAIPLTDGAAAPLGLALLFPLALPGMRKTKVLLILLAVFGAGLCLEKSLLLHYAAPVIPAVMLLAMQGMRVARVVSVGRQRPGLRLIALVMVAIAGMATLHIIRHREVEIPPVIAARLNVERKLSTEPGQHVVLVRYRADHDVHREIVYNGADIDAQKIVWAIDRGAMEDRRLIEYYRGRHIWLLQPDGQTPTLTPYPMS